MNTKVAVLFGLNYPGTEHELRGCVNDVENMSEFLSSKGYSCDINTSYDSTTANSIMSKLYLLAKQSHTDNLTDVWIHYSGHGTYIMDKNGDECDGKDECFVPSDCVLIPDDFLKNIIRYFNPSTRIIVVADCCHSGTIMDLKYNWNLNDKTSNSTTVDGLKSNVICISGCRDDQTSEDAYLYNRKDSKYEFAGAMTSYLLEFISLQGCTKVFDIVQKMNVALSHRGFTQRPRLTSSFIIDDTEDLI